PETSDENLSPSLLARGEIDDPHRLPGEVHEHLLAGRVNLADGDVEALLPAAVSLAELGVLQPVGVGSLVLRPEELQGDVLALLQLLVDPGGIGFRPGLVRVWRLRVEELL